MIEWKVTVRSDGRRGEASATLHFDVTAPDVALASAAAIAKAKEVGVTDPVVTAITNAKPLTATVVCDAIPNLPDFPCDLPREPE